MHQSRRKCKYNYSKKRYIIKSGAKINGSKPQVKYTKNENVATNSKIINYIVEIVEHILLKTEI